jgi:hypothetical protein
VTDTPSRPAPQQEQAAPDTRVQLVSGRSYIDGHGDTKGPMHERTPGVWLDQHGALFHCNGAQWNHTHDSAGNLKKEAK